MISAGAGKTQHQQNWRRSPTFWQRTWSENINSRWIVGIFRRFNFRRIGLSFISRCSHHADQGYFWVCSYASDESFIVPQRPHEPRQLALLCRNPLIVIDITSLPTLLSNFRNLVDGLFALPISQSLQYLLVGSDKRKDSCKCCHRHT